MATMTTRDFPIGDVIQFYYNLGPSFDPFRSVEVAKFLLNGRDSELMQNARLDVRRQFPAIKDIPIVGLLKDIERLTQEGRSVPEYYTRWLDHIAPQFGRFVTLQPME
ncbi:MAG: hypothetical protein INF43_05660 [Alphaproteobacteria bacterium]|nr:hypothetical protein [Alphaproteobacteria bacterium]